MEWKLYPVSEFSKFQDQWQDLNVAIGNSPLLDPKFIIPLINNFSNGSEKIALFGDAENPGIMTVVTPVKKSMWATFQPSNAPLGLWLSRDKNLDISSVRSLIKQLPGVIISMSITQQDPLFMTRPDTGKSVSSLDYIETAHIDFPEKFDNYWAIRSKNLRHNMKRQRNFLTKNNIETRLELFSYGEQMKLAVMDYGNIESSGWKGQIDSAVSHGDSQSQFYTEMLASFSVTGESLVLRYYYNEKLVATDLCLLRNKILYILKTTYDETIKGTSPAHIMRFEYYQTALASGSLKRVEFYGPLKDWHKKWTHETRTIFHTNIYRNSYIAWAHKIKKLIG